MRAILFLVALAVSAEAMSQKSGKIETDHGTVEWSEQTSDTPPVTKVIRSLTESEESILRASKNRAETFIQNYTIASDRDSDLLLNLDSAFASWLLSARAEKETEKEVIEIVGSALGYYCIEKLQMRWAVIQDEHGDAVALVKDDLQIQSFPFTSVQYRIEDRKVNFIYALYAVIEQLVKNSEA